MRLIEANHVANEIHKKFKYAKSDIEAGAFLAALYLIDCAPTIEAEPIKYGYWEWVDGSPDNYDLKCTVCGGVQDSGFWERCPYCGAKMKNGE